MRGLAILPAKLVAVGLLLAACCGVPALAQQRVALVIGDSSYQHAPRLPNPVNVVACGLP